MNADGLAGNSGIHATAQAQSPTAKQPLQRIVLGDSAIPSYICSVARIIGIDFGLKRTGLAWTDPMQIIATGLETVLSPDLVPRLQVLLQKEQVEKIVLGMPYKLDGSDTDTTRPVLNLQKKLAALFPTVEIVLWDEQYSSKKAMQAMIQGGVSKKNRRDKALIDKVSATIILQDYLSSNSL